MRQSVGARPYRLEQPRTQKGYQQTGGPEESVFSFTITPLVEIHIHVCSARGFPRRGAGTGVLRAPSNLRIYDLLEGEGIATLEERLKVVRPSSASDN